MFVCRRQGSPLYSKKSLMMEKRKAKGNCDADLVVKAMKDAYESNADRIVLVT